MILKWLNSISKLDMRIFVALAIATGIAGGKITYFLLTK